MNARLIERVDRLINREQGTVFKDPGGRISIALVYPNTYSLGMSNLGFQGIYGLLNDMSDVVCERFFFPSDDDLSEYIRTETELFSFESKRSLARFDIVAFSVSFENDYPNVPRMLSLSNIPPRRAVRTEKHPIIIMGGVCAFFNPEPLSDFFDAVFIGEAEEMLPEFIDIIRRGGTRKEVLRDAAAIEGIYIPDNYLIGYDENTGRIVSRKSEEGYPAVVRKRTVRDLSRFSFRQVITTPDTEFSDMALLEAMRGCAWSCRFCVAGHIYKPVRRKDSETLKAEISGARERTGRVGLIGPSLSDYPNIEELLGIDGVNFSITSLRAGPRTARIVGMMKGHKSVSIAPEAGTQRLRDVIGKKINEEDILTASSMILGGGIETLRLYFMIGLPTETMDDIEGIIGLVSKVRSSANKGFITVSANVFVPKPFTPFQWHQMAGLKDVKMRLATIKKGLSRLKGVRVFHDVPKYAYMQGLFSVGDRRLSSLIEDIGTAGMSFSLANTKGSGTDAAFYIFREKERSEMFPWDFIDAGISKDHLWDEYKKALEA